MHWQDWILTFGTVIFSIALIPSLLSKDKPALSTSLLTGTVLAIFAVIYATLSLWLSTVFTAILAVLWLTLGMQKIRQNKH